MKIELYPAFEAVFYDQTLKGIFYPLCSVTLADEAETKLHFVSSNGIWTNNDNTSENNNSQFIAFDLIDGKYAFNGNVDLYNGHQEAKKIFPLLEADFNENSRKYLDAKLKTKNYIDEIKKIIPTTGDESLDLNYYLQAFYEFSINKINAQLNRGFGQFQRLINGYAKPEQSPMVYDDATILSRIDIPDGLSLNNFKAIGMTIGSEFFTDGNDTVLFYNEIEKQVLCINSYS